MTTAGRPAVLGVDGGNSKTELMLTDADGVVLGTSRGPTVSHQRIPLAAAMERLAALVRDLSRTAGVDWPDRGPLARVGVYALAGADFPTDVRMLREAIAALGLTEEVVVVNDTLAALRAGTTRSWGIALICGHGVNGVGTAPDGTTARFDSLGDISGDWGGGAGIGLAAHAAAVRASDGRGPTTALQRLIPAHFDLDSPGALVQALYTQRIDPARLGELSPLVFETATAGDGVARDIVLQQARELTAMATALARRLDVAGLDVDVVLAGSVFENDNEDFWRQLTDGVHEAIPAARLAKLTNPPVHGSALLGLDHLAPTGTPTLRQD